MRGMRGLGLAAAAGLGMLAVGCARQEGADRAMAAAVLDTGSMQIPDHSMGNLRQGPLGPGTFQVAPAGPDTGSMQIPEHSMGNLRRSPPTGPGGFLQASPTVPDTGSMQIPEHSMGNLRGTGTTR